MGTVRAGTPSSALLREMYPSTYTPLGKVSRSVRRSRSDRRAVTVTSVSPPAGTVTTVAAPSAELPPSAPEKVTEASRTRARWSIVPLSAVSVSRSAEST